MPICHILTETFHAVMLWRDLLPPAVMAGLWSNEFFPRWLEVLHMWLSNQPNYDEVTRWYLSWKGAFPAELLEHPAIVMQFNRYVRFRRSRLRLGRS